jgi:hypothetical protein
VRAGHGDIVTAKCGCTVHRVSWQQGHLAAKKRRDGIMVEARAGCRVGPWRVHCLGERGVVHALSHA